LCIPLSQTTIPIPLKNNQKNAKYRYDTGKVSSLPERQRQRTWLRAASRRRAERSGERGAQYARQSRSDDETRRGQAKTSQRCEQRHTPAARETQQSESGPRSGPAQKGTTCVRAAGSCCLRERAGSPSAAPSPHAGPRARPSDSRLSWSRRCLWQLKIGVTIFGLALRARRPYS
jgi:hypothetical protein